MLNRVSVIWIMVSALFLSAGELEEQERACQLGDMEICTKVGVVLTTGEYAKDQDKKERGVEYLRKACKYGQNSACDALGENYFREKHFGAARPYYEAACERGVGHACMGLGTIYRDGHKVRQDDVLSRVYYEKACVLKEADACISVAIIYRGGFGVTISREKEKHFYQLACTAGSQAGCESFTALDNEDKGIEGPSLWERFKSLFN